MIFSLKFVHFLLVFLQILKSMNFLLVLMIFSLNNLQMQKIILKMQVVQTFFWCNLALQEGRMCDVGPQATSRLIRASAQRHPALRGSLRGKGMDTTPEKKLRRNLTPLKVYCLENERDVIIRNAVATGKTVSEYMRNVSMGYRVPSNINAEQARELVRLKGDMGRLGGLLKLLLSNEERFDGMTGERLQLETLKLLNEILENQKQVRQAIRELIRN